MRVGVMYYHRTNRDQLGERNFAVPASTYTPFTFNVPAGGGLSAPTSVTVFNRAPALASAQDIVRDNQPYLDTEFNGVGITAAKRFTNRWQMIAGLTFGKNRGGLNNNTSSPGGSGQSLTNDLNDPNWTLYERGIVGNDSEVAFRLSGSYLTPLWDINVAGSLVSNGGYPVISTFNVTRALAATQGVTLTQASVTVPLTERGEERLPSVTMLDLRFSRAFRFAGGRQIVPQLDIFNISNADTVVNRTNAIGTAYLTPVEILAPRIIRVGFSIDF
jgi:hypothetical protein